jgi:hypothetical protein
MQDERKPDLGGSDYDELEKRVDEMLEPAVEAPKSDEKQQPATPQSAPKVKGAKKIAITHHEDEPKPEDVVTIPEAEAGKTVEEAAAEAVAAKKPKKVAITHYDDSGTQQSEAAPETPETETVPVLEATDEDEISAEPEDEITEELLDESNDEAVEDADEEECSEETREEVVEESPEADPETPEAEEVPVADDTPEDLPDELDDPLTAKAIDDIVAAEGDKVLEAEDAEIAQAFSGEKQSFKQKVKTFFAAWWHNKKARYGTLIAIALSVVVAGIIPTSRYFVLNNVGVRAGLSVTVFDESTTQPLKNVTVSIGSVSQKTDKDGKAKLSGLKLGKAKLVVGKRAFAENTKQLTLGWGSNPQGDIKLTPTGSQYTFSTTDFLSGKAVQGVEASSGEASAIADDKGKIVLTIDKNDDRDEIDVTLKLDGYREETRKINADTKDEQAVKMVTARKHVFISKRGGKFDVYKVDIDGQNEQLVLAGTGKERDDMVLVPHPTENLVALVSTRDGKYNKEGYLLSSLQIIDLADNAATNLAESERVQVVDWLKGRLVYVEISAGASAANPRRHRLMSYDFKNDQNKELATSNYFNDVLVATGRLYYAPSSAYQNGASTYFYQIESDGTNRQTILTEEVWNALRTNYETITLSVQQKWYSLTLGQGKPNKLDGAPATTVNRLYVDSPDGKNSLWTEERDGKGVLLNYDVASKKDAELKKLSGLKNPIRWLTDRIIVYRISTPSETADYTMSLDGGESVKIRDVTNTSSIENWYYY